MPLAAQRLSKATLADVKALNKLVDQASTAEMGIVILSGVVNLKTCSVVCYADAAHHPELVKTGHFDLSAITSCQSTTTKRVVRSTLAAVGHAVSEGLEPPQWKRHLLTEAHMARSSLTDVEKESLKRPALLFTDSDRLANTVKKDVVQSHDRRFRIVVYARVPISGEQFADVVADSFASRTSLDEGEVERTFLPRSSTVVRTSP